jgi:hypothetical protein
MVTTTTKQNKKIIRHSFFLSFALFSFSLVILKNHSRKERETIRRRRRRRGQRSSSMVLTIQGRKPTHATWQANAHTTHHTPYNMHKQT